MSLFIKRQVCLRPKLDIRFVKGLQSDGMYMKFLLVIFLALPVYSAQMSKASLAEYSSKVKPILNKYCFSCHGEKKQKGKIRLDDFSVDLFNDQVSETWHDVLDLMNTGEMPPEDEKQPSLKELDTVTSWLTKELKAVTIAKKNLGGNPVRRLTRYEYQNTMEELLGLKLNYSSDLPPEGLSEDGFKNNGTSMQMSPLQLDFYLQTARNALGKAIVQGKQPKPFKYQTAKANTTNQTKRRASKDSEITPGELFGVRMLDHPLKGPFKITIKTKVKLVKGQGAPRMRVMLGYKPDVTITEAPVYKDFDVNKDGTYTFTGYLDEFNMPNGNKGKFPGLMISIYNVYDDGTLSFTAPKKPKKKKDKKGKKGKKEEVSKPQPPQKVEPSLIIQSVEFEAPYYASWPPKYHSEILPDSPLKKSNEALYVKGVLKKFMQRAYRRKIEDRDVAWIMSYYDKIRPDFPNLEKTMREVLAIVLASPDFLYRLEPTGKTDKEIGEYELASRLSYFLWSSMPDNQLFALATKGKLKDPKTLSQQVDRMLKDKKSWNFIDNFTTQWLDLDGIDRVAINPQFYPKFDNTMKVDIRDEAKHFFATILHKDLSALNFLDSDFMVVNNRLSRYYGEKSGNVSGAFKVVPLSPDSRRGGLLTQASMLLATSTGDDSHPIKRAVWLRERILHDPPSPPPPDVPALDSTDPNFHKLSTKEQLAVHRNVQACVRCHRGIDGWGIPFEEFDGVGLYRTKSQRAIGKKKFTVKVDASSELPGSIKINGMEELKKYLIKNEKDRFAHALANKFLTYSLGRTLDITDEEIVDEIAKKFKASGYKLNTLIKAVVGSKLFLQK